MKSHQWKQISNPSGGQTIEKCANCGILCAIDPDYPKIRWDYKKYPGKIPIDCDCDATLVDEIMKS